LIDYDNLISKIRRDFPFFNTENGKNLIYMDNAATTLKPQIVLDAMLQYYIEYPANIHRAVFDISQQASDAYENARKIVAQFIGANSSDEVIFTSGTTASINHFSRAFAETYLREGDRIILSAMEHHANLLPWHKIAKDYKCTLEFIPILADGELDLNQIDELLSKPTRLLAITAISNTLGTINPIHQLTAKCKELGIYTFIDAAQSIPHMKYVLMKDTIDFLVFSGHKIFAPTGIGVLWGRKELLKKMPPFFLGGGIVYDVDLNTAIFSSIPSRFEAGTPPIAEAIGLGAALMYVDSIGWEIIYNIEQKHLYLGIKTFEKFRDYITIYGTAKNKIPIFSFIINEIHPHDIGSFLNEWSIAFRTGHQCTQPIWKNYKISSVTRASTSIYNSFEEWDRISDAFNSLLEFFHVRKFS